MRSAWIASLVLLAAWLAIAAGQQSPKIEIPKLPTAVNQFGGRPGTFHFVTNEQHMADLAELQRAFAALDRLDGGAAKLDGRTRAQFQADLQSVRAFAMNAYQRQGASAGPSAAEVEARLNAAKGNFMCGACHGHGMMHGQGMGMHGPGGPAN